MSNKKQTSEVEVKTPTIQELPTNEIFEILASQTFDENTGDLLDELESRFDKLNGDENVPKVLIELYPDELDFDEVQDEPV